MFINLFFTYLFIWLAIRNYNVPNYILRNSYQNVTNVTDIILMY
jgi:hypothetical protein